MGLVHPTMQGVPVVRPRVHLLMEQGLTVTARDLRTRVNPVVHRMDLAHRTMQSVPAVGPRVHLHMKGNQRAGERKIEPIRRAKYQSTVEFLLSVFFLTPLR